VIIAGNADSIFNRLMRAIGRSDLAEDPRLAGNEGRAQHNQMIDDAIGEWTSKCELEYVLDVLEKTGVPSGKIYTSADIYTDPHFRARDMIQPIRLPDGTVTDFPGIVPKLSETPGATNWLGPELGQQVEEVLTSIGIIRAALEELRAEEVV